MFLVFGKIPGMRLGGVYPLPVFLQGRVDAHSLKSGQPLAYRLFVFLFEYLRVFAARSGAVVAIHPVVGHLVQEEKGQHFYSLRKELLLLVEMRLYRLANLYSP